MITELHLSRLIYEEDPRNTCCRVNEGMEDEYDRVAGHIVQQLKFGIPFKTAFHDIFSFFWWSGNMIENPFAVAVVEAQYYNHIIHHEHLVIIPKYITEKPNVLQNRVSLQREHRRRQKE